MKTLSKASVNNVRQGLFMLIDQFVAALPYESCGKNVLIIRTDGIGDFVIWLDAAQAIVKKYHKQGKSVTLLASALWSTWADQLGIFDEVVSIDYARFNTSLKYRIQIELFLRRRNFYTVLQPVYTRNYFMDLLVRLTGAIERIGWMGENADKYLRMKELRDSWYTKLIFDDSPRMEILRNADFVRQVADPAYLCKMSDLRTFVASKLDEGFSSKFQLQESYYVLFPGAGWARKRWGIVNFSKLAERLYHETGWRGIVCGGPDDNVLAEDLCRTCSAPLLNWAGQTDLAQLTTILGNAKILVANDTAAVHIAASMGTRTICLLGGGHDARFLPYKMELEDDRQSPIAIVHRLPCFGCRWNCIYDISGEKTAPCVADISLDSVWNSTNNAIKDIALLQSS